MLGRKKLVCYLCLQYLQGVHLVFFFHTREIKMANRREKNDRTHIIYDFYQKNVRPL